MDSEMKDIAVPIERGEVEKGVGPFDDLVGDLEIPPELEESFRKHREHVLGLVRSLRSAGINEDQIEESVSVIVASYKGELVHTLKSLKRFV